MIRPREQEARKIRSISNPLVNGRITSRECSDRQWWRWRPTHVKEQENATSTAVSGRGRSCKVCARPTVSTLFSLLSISTLALLLVVSVSVISAQRQNLPDLSDTSSKPIRVSVGDTINIDCVVKNRNNLTVLWQYVNGSAQALLAANEAVISEDKRLSVIHQADQERWILQIKYARLQDTGIYRCEVNSNPKVYETRMVMVSIKRTFADVLKAIRQDALNNGTTLIPGRTPYTPDKPLIGPKTGVAGANFTDRSFYECCQTEGVPILCRPLCSLNAMISDQTKPYMYTLCYNYMTHIYRCLADGRNHLPCCVRQKVPQLCQPACTGRYSLEKALDHAICHEHSKTVLFCIADGIQTLPEQPQEVSVETVNSTYIQIKWTNREPISTEQAKYRIVWRELNGFDENWQRVNTSLVAEGRMRTLTIPTNRTEIVLGPLKEATMYEVRMIAFNRFGESLPTNDLRVVTHSIPKASPEEGGTRKKVIDNGNVEKTEVEDVNSDKVPNLRRCCVAQGVKTESCLKQLCEPFIIEPMEVEESIMCMKYMNTSYKCIDEVRENVDYEKCCEEEGVSGFCKHFCSGRSSLLHDFQSQFQCLPYMSSLVSCVLERKGYVTTEPLAVQVSSVHNDWALVQWKPPKKKAESIDKYQVHYREMVEEADDFYFVETSTKSPFLIDKLRPATKYEVFVTTVNKFGVSRGSVRVLFNTTSPEIDPILDQIDQTDTSLGYNETHCCEQAGVTPTCLPLCDYHLKMKDLFRLSLACAEPKTARTILRCLAAGRDHRPCCERRGIDNECFDLCNGMITFTSKTIATKCSKYDGKIFQCMAEGADTLPGSPIHLHAANITAASIGLAWNKSLDELPIKDPITYQIRYSPLPANQTIPPHPFDDRFSTKLNVTNARFTLTNLRPNTTYSIYVVSSNKFGSSAPSQVLLVTTNDVDSDTIPNTAVIHATIGAPHGLELMRKSITALMFRWAEPHYASPDVKFSYDVFFQKIQTARKDSTPANVTKNWIVLNTASNVISIQNLTRNTQYAIAVRARTSSGLVSPLSETVLAWTDPSLPLEISQPFIHPFPVTEGSMVTIRCESIGYPVPNMTVYVNGVKVKSEPARVIHYSIDYVERNLSAIACQAVNEESRHPVQSFREVNVHFAPTITLAKETKMVLKYSMAMLECEFSGFPKPKVRFLRGSMLVSRFNNSRVFPHLKKPKTWVATLVISNVNETHQGDYDCTARNDYGEEKKTLKLLVQDVEHVPKNHTACCEQKNILSECMFVCTDKKDINLFDVYKNQKCLEHLNKYIACAADGSDHRRCCMFREVAPECLHWCAGYKLQKVDFCLVSSARDVMSCFREGNKFLPSPPVRVHVEGVHSESHVRVAWDDSDKNRDASHWYWVYWKKVGTNEMDRERVESNRYDLRELDPEATYEFVVKTTNYHGTSVLSEPLVINLSKIRADYLVAESGWFANLMLTTFLLVLIVASAGFLLYLTYKNNYFPNLRPLVLNGGGSGRSSLGVSFENRAYNLEDTIPMEENRSTTLNTATIVPSATNNGNGVVRNGNVATTMANGNGNGHHFADQNNNPNGQPRVQIRLP